MPQPTPSPGMMPRRHPDSPVPPKITAPADNPWYCDPIKIESFYVKKLWEHTEIDTPAAYDHDTLFDLVLGESGIDVNDLRFSRSRHETRFRKQICTYANSKTPAFRVYDDIPGLISVMPGHLFGQWARHPMRRMLSDNLKIVETAARSFVDQLNHVAYQDQVYSAAGLLDLREEMEIHLPGPRYESAILPFVRLDERVNYDAERGYALIPHARTAYESPTY